jgi:hypothetical protein
MYWKEKWLYTNVHNKAVGTARILVSVVSMCQSF